MARAVFLDRDGVLIRDVNYLCRIEQIEILAGVGAALKLLRGAGFKLVVVTNQSVVARGKLTEAGLSEIHRVLNEMLAAEGAPLDAFYYCPHHPTEGIGVYKVVCDCRKPKAGMIERAVREMGLEPMNSYVVGDQASDMELAVRVGAQALLINGAESGAMANPAANATFANLLQAAHWIVSHS